MQNHIRIAQSYTNGVETQEVLYLNKNLAPGLPIETKILIW